MLRAMTLPGSEYVMPAIFPGFIRDWGDSLFRLAADRGLHLGRATEMWSAYASLAESENRQAFARILRSVIDPGGQSVSAMDRLYLTERLPTLIVWGDKDDIIPLAHAHAAHAAIPGSQIEAPEAFVGALITFMDATAPAHLGAADRQQMLRARSASA